MTPLAHPGCDREVRGHVKEDPSCCAGPGIQVYDFEPAQALHGALRSQTPILRTSKGTLRIRSVRACTGLIRVTFVSVLVESERA